MIRRSRGGRLRRRSPSEDEATAASSAEAADDVQTDLRERTMATLTVWKFDSPTGADQAVGTLESLAKQQLIVVHDETTV